MRYIRYIPRYIVSFIKPMRYLLFLHTLNYRKNLNKMVSLPRETGVGGNAGGARSGGSYVLSLMFTEGWQDCNNLDREAQADAYLTGSDIARRMSFVAHEYPSWSDALTRVAVGVVVLSRYERDRRVRSRPLPPSFDWGYASPIPLRPDIYVRECRTQAL